MDITRRAFRGAKELRYGSLTVCSTPYIIGILSKKVLVLTRPDAFIPRISLGDVLGPWML